VCFFSTTFVWNIPHAQKKWVRYDLKCTLVFMKSTRYSCQIIKKLEFSTQIFEKYSNIKFHENQFNGSQDVPCWRTDMMKLLVAFRNFVNTLKTLIQKTLNLSPKTCKSNQLTWCRTILKLSKCLRYHKWYFYEEELWTCTLCSNF
jgi:hypothetical protein